MRTEQDDNVNEMRKHLVEMGYSHEQIAHAVANDIKDAGLAIDFLERALLIPPTATASSTSAVAATGSTVAPSTGVTAVSDLIAPISDQEAQLQQAIVESKSDEHARARASQDDPQLAKAIAESLKDAAQPQPSWQDHSFTMSPDQRVRTDMCVPVGLRNIGNTCYLNSLLQVYFHLPAFRRTVLEYRRPRHVDATPEARETNEKPADPIAQLSRPTVSAEHAHVFMVELQRLFAIMSLGNQSIVDPSNVVRAIRNADGKQIEIGAQEDSAEFNQLLLDMVHRAVSPGPPQSPAESSMEHNGDVTMRPPVSPRARPQDDLVRSLFITKFKQELVPSTGERGEQQAASSARMTVSHGETSVFFVDATSEENRNIYSGLDEHAQTRIEYRFDAPDAESNSCSQSAATESMHADLPPDAMRVDNGSPPSAGTVRKRAEPAVKTEWITSLAPVLTIFLKRVRYNRQSAAPEKVHEPYMFDTTLSVDRYLEKNRDESERARKKLRTLRAERDQVSQLLNGILRFPITPTDATPAHEQQTVAERPAFIGPLEQKDSTTMDTQPDYSSTSAPHSPSAAPDTHRDDYFVALDRIKKRLLEAQNPESPYYVRSLTAHKVQQAVATLEQLEENDRVQTATLKERNELLAHAESACYRALNSTVYELYAILVHDGAPMSGHYLVFIRSSVKDDEGKTRWMRLSDISVTYVSEEEMFNWSMGGHGHASAYCLIYASASELANSGSAPFEPEGVKFEEACRALLPKERLEEVQQSCVAFESELLNHRIKVHKEKAIADAKSILELATSELKQASQVPNAGASALDLGSTPHQPWRSKTAVEFCIASGLDILALSHALKFAWAHHMTYDSSKNIFDVIRRHMLSSNQFPPVDGNTSPEQVLSTDPDILILEEILQIMEKPGDMKLASGDLPFLGHPKMKQLRDELTGQTGSLESRMHKLRKFYTFALRSNALAVAALRATFKGTWKIALWRLYHLKQEDHVLLSATDQNLAIAKEFFKSPYFKFCQHNDLANYIGLSVTLAASEHAAGLLVGGSAEGQKLAVFMAEHAMRIFGRDAAIIDCIRKDWEGHRRDWTGPRNSIRNQQEREVAIQTAANVLQIMSSRVISPNIRSFANIDREAKQAIENAEENATQFSWSLITLHAKVNQLGLIALDVPAARKAAWDLRDHAISVGGA